MSRGETRVEEKYRLIHEKIVSVEFSIHKTVRSASVWDRRTSINGEK